MTHTWPTTFNSDHCSFSPLCLGVRMDLIVTDSGFLYIESFYSVLENMHRIQLNHVSIGSNTYLCQLDIRHDHFSPLQSFKVQFINTNDDKNNHTDCRDAVVVSSAYVEVATEHVHASTECPNIVIFLMASMMEI